MYGKVDDEDGDPRWIDDVEQLRQWAAYLPTHISSSLLPHLTEEMASTAGELTAQADGTRQLLLQDAALRRSTVLTPLLKEQLAVKAAQLQRRRAHLVQTLQGLVKLWRTGGSTTGGSSDRRKRSDGESDAALREVWTTVSDAIQFEEDTAYLVQAPLCPSPAALRAFLHDAVVTRCGLHHRVVQQVAGGAPLSGACPAVFPGHAGPSSEKDIEIGGSRRGDNSAVTATTTSSPTSPTGDAKGEEDAIEAALQLLLHHVKLATTRPIKKKSGGGTARPTTDHHSIERCGPRSASSKPPNASMPTDVSGSTASVPNGDAADACDVDVYFDDVEGGEAEEDIIAARHLRGTTITSGPPSTGESAAPSASAPPLTPAALWLRVPAVLSLGQYCAELPWVADVAEQRYGEERERRKHGGTGEIRYGGRPASLSGNGGDGGDGGTEVKQRLEAMDYPLAPGVARTMPPLGPSILPALAAAVQDGDGDRAAGTTSSMGSARYTASSAASTTGLTSASSFDRESALAGGGDAPHDEERLRLARVVVQCVTAAVDNEWKDLEAVLVQPFCCNRSPLSSPPRHERKRGGEERTAGQGDTEEDDESLSQFLDVVRVRYAVELSAQVLAARHAMELMMDSEDGVIFEGARLMSLLVTMGGGDREACHGASASPPRFHPSAPPASFLTCTTLSLPGLQQVFYVVAYCTGAALVHDARSAVSRESRSALGRLGSCAAGRRRPLFVDVDDDDDDIADGDVRCTAGPFSSAVSQTSLVGAAAAATRHANEEDPVAQQQAALQAWAAAFEWKYLRGGVETPDVAPPRRTATLSADPMLSAFSMTSYYRLWLYLWEFVLHVVPPSSSAATADPYDEPQKLTGPQRRSLVTPPSDARRGASPSELNVSYRTARRWMEKVINASLARGCAEAGLLVRRPTMAGPSVSPVTCIATLFTTEQAAGVVSATAKQARQSFRRVSQMEGLD